MATQQQIDDIRTASLHGGHLALDFVNTVDWRLGPQPHDLLSDYEVLAHWGHRLGVVSGDELARIVADAPGHPRKSRDALARAVDLRELLYRVFAATAEAKTPGRRDLQALNEAFADAVAHATFGPGEARFGWSWAGTDHWRRIAWAVAAAAVDLLRAGDLARIKQCRDEGCGWLFVDTSKNASRRWCSMQGCGTRAKMRRQYRRKKARRAPSGRPAPPFGP